MHDNDTQRDGRTLRPGPEPGALPLQERCDRMTALAGEYRRAGPLTDEAFAALLLADLIGYVEETCEESIGHLLDAASMHLRAEVDPLDIRWRDEVLLAGEELPLAHLRDPEERAERIDVVVAAFAPTSGTNPDELATDILTDLWTWCEHRDIAGPDLLLPTAEVLHLMATGNLH